MAAISQARSAQIKSLNTDKDISIKECINELVFIINSMCNKNKKDGDIQEIRDGFMVAKGENPVAIIMNAGPYFWKYRTHIERGDVNSLLNMEYKEEISEVQESLADNSKFEKISVVMQKVKRTWHLLTPTEQETMKKKFKLILIKYTGYLVACKKLKDLGCL